MQLKKKSANRAQLAAATVGLLGAAAPPAQANFLDDLGNGTRPWEFDTAVLVYSENDGRVQLAEPVLQVRKNLGDERWLSAKLVVDALTGASPIGATPASTPQTFSRPSGNGTFTTAAGETPLDDTFRDTRVALSGDYFFPVSEDGKLGIGLNASNEFDFFSAGGSMRYTHDFNRGNTTLSAGLNFEQDSVDPVGGVPVALAVLPAPGADITAVRQGGSESKTVTDLMLGVSQVLDPLSVVQVNYSLSLSDGYQTDPYKVLSVVDGNGEPLYYVYEGRPDQRSKHALFGRYKRFVYDRDVLDLSYRFMTDDWGINSHTLDIAYRWNYSGLSYVEPHLRAYSQSAAEFYRVALDDGEDASLLHASADPRLGPFDAWTAGLKYGHTLSSGNEWSARLEYYRQAGRLDGLPPAAAGGLTKFDLEPDVSAVMLTLGYRFRW